MSGAVRPHIGIITNVGTSHLEHLGSRENIARAKLEILTGIQPGGHLLVQGDEPLLQDPALLVETGRSDVHILRLSLTDPAADVYARPAEAPENGGMAFDLTLPGAHWPGMTIPAPGTHMVQAAAFGATVGYLCGLDQGAVQAGLTRYRPAALRQTVDTYNACCAEGMDWDCFKPSEWLNPIAEAPFYGVKASLGTDGAFGGVEIDEKMRAKAADGGVVEGLYVTGDLASGRFINMAGIKKQILNDMSFALSSGYLAGTGAAAYVG